MIHDLGRGLRPRRAEAFHEAYLTHTTTSPNYQILASLDLARRQVDLEGYGLVRAGHRGQLALRRKRSRATRCSAGTSASSTPAT